MRIGTWLTAADYFLRKEYSMNRLYAAIALFLLVASLPCSTHAGTPSAPVYNPATKSYFQLFSDNKSPGTWIAAQKRAREKILKGVRGRLAVVDDYQTHQFLIEHFDLSDARRPTWIGLRYWCPVRMLQWEGGRLYSPTDPDRFQTWHTPWHRTSITCDTSVRTYMPAYYRYMNGSTSWQTSGPHKFFDYYLVEFPTGKK